MGVNWIPSIILLSFILAALVTAKKVKWVPPYCCVPDQFTAKLKNTATTYKHFSLEKQADVDFTYDYTNTRWALHWRDPQNDTRFIRTMHDYKNGYKMIETESFCEKTELDGPMQQHCISSNSSYDGALTYGYGDRTFVADQWTYDYAIYPTRSIRLVSRQNCAPLTDMTGLVVKNTWHWDVGEPGCIPWEEPRKAARGKCYMSFRSKTARTSVVEFTSVLMNIEYRNLELGIAKPEMFEFPKSCKTVSVDKWSKDVPLWDLWRAYFFRFNTDNPLDPGNMSLRPG